MMFIPRFMEIRKLVQKLVLREAESYTISMNLLAKKKTVLMSSFW